MDRFARVEVAARNMLQNNKLERYPTRTLWYGTTVLVGTSDTRTHGEAKGELRR